MPIKPRPSKPIKKKKRNQLNSYLKYSGLAMQMTITIGLMAFVGYKLDIYFALKFPAFLLVLVFTALFASIYLLYKSLQ